MTKSKVLQELKEWSLCYKKDPAQEQKIDPFFEALRRIHLHLFVSILMEVGTVYLAQFLIPGSEAFIESALDNAYQFPSIIVWLISALVMLRIAKRPSYLLYRTISRKKYYLS